MRSKRTLFALFLCVVAFISIGTVQSFALYDNYYVSNFRDFKIAISGAKNTDCIIFENDINLESSVKINTSITLDLNGHTLFLPNNDAVIDIGDKEFDHTEKYTETKPGYFNYEHKKKTVYHPETGTFTEEYVTERVWHPATTVEKTRDVFRYFDDLDIIIKNGKIIRKDGANGEDGKKDTWSDYNGKNGETPREIINMISGTIRFANSMVYAGNGGNGGNGSYQSLIHVPFGGGSGGNGGNGGDGGNVILKTRNECRIFADEISKLIPGKAGKGGEMSKANDSYYIYRGWNGDNGKDGKDGAQILVVTN